MRSLLLLILFALPTYAQAIESFDYRVVEKRPQSRALFTQGLEIHGDHLYVSSGKYGKSRLLRLEQNTGEVVLERRLSRAFFAEGLTLLGDHIYQLTWQNRVMFVYRQDTFEPVGKHALPGEGWGLTNDGHSLIYSDGSATLRFIDPQTGAQRRSLTVTEHGEPLPRLNELEWIDGEIWANVWLTQRIVRIDPSSGKVTGSANLEGLLDASDWRNDTDVLNGIAYDRARNALWVTGKHWPWRFHIELVPAEREQQDDVN